MDIAFPLRVRGRFLDSRSLALRAVFAVVALATAFQFAHSLAGFGGHALDALSDEWLYTALELSAVALCFARARARREDRLAWTLIGAGLLAWSSGDFIWTVWLDHVAEPPYPNVADGFYLALYPSTYAGLTLMVRSHFRHTGAAVWLDGIVVGLSIAALGADLVFPAVLGGASGNDASVAVNLAYPFCDGLLLVFLALGFALSGWRPGRQWLLLAAGVALNATADMIYVYQVAKGTYVEGGVLNAMWPASMAIVALAAWQPQRDGRARDGVREAQAVVLPTGFALVALTLVFSATVHPVTRTAVGLATAALLAAGVRAAFTYRENVSVLERETLAATTDTLTGLGNRRRLMEDLETAVQLAERGVPATLAFFDLDGFKRYNDSFGHGAGDSLLLRLGTCLAEAVGDYGEAYRLGGDEFCVLYHGRHRQGEAVVRAAQAALAERGAGFVVTASCGTVVLPEDADTVGGALNLADERMYVDKAGSEHSSRARAQAVLTQQNVLMALLTEHEPDLHDHVCDVGELAAALGRRFGMDSEQLDELRRGAELHDIGKLAVPDHILGKPGPFSDSEWALMRQHTIIGERILNAAPALRPVALLVRSSHERWDGGGYPDGLAGEEIPLGSRIISACDAYDAMVSERSHDAPRPRREALEELRRAAGSQFDPAVIDVLGAHLEDDQERLSLRAETADIQRDVPTSSSSARASGGGSRSL